MISSRLEMQQYQPVTKAVLTLYPNGNILRNFVVQPVVATREELLSRSHSILLRQRAVALSHQQQPGCEA